MKELFDLLTPVLGGGREALLSVLFAFVIPKVLQKIKCSDIPLMKEGAWRLNRAVAIGAGVIAAVGIHTTFIVNDQGWSLTLAGAHTSIGAFLLDVLKQFWMQQGVYKGIVDKVDRDRTISNPATRRVTGALFLVITAGAAAGIGCTAARPPQPIIISAATSIAPSADEVQATRRLAVNIADEVRKVTAVIRQVRSASERANRLGIIPNKRMDQIDEACLRYVAMARLALQAAEKALTRPSLLNIAEMVWATTSDLIKELNRAGVSDLSEIAKTIKGLMPVTFATSGSRS
jgi:hypothetical protein